MLKALRKGLTSLLEMLKEAGIYSINRVLPAITWLVLTILVLTTTVYLVISKASWAHYGELVTLYLTSLGIVATWLTGNKVANSKYNTPEGSPGKPLTASQQKVVDNVVNIASAVEQKLGERK